MKIDHIQLAKKIRTNIPEVIGYKDAQNKGTLGVLIHNFVTGDFEPF